MLKFDLPPTRAAIKLACQAWSYTITIHGTDFWRPAGSTETKTFTFTCTLTR